MAGAVVAAAGGVRACAAVVVVAAAGGAAAVGVGFACAAAAGATVVVGVGFACVAAGGAGAGAAVVVGADNEALADVRGRAAPVRLLASALHVISAADAIALNREWLRPA